MAESYVSNIIKMPEVKFNWRKRQKKREKKIKKQKCKVERRKTHLWLWLCCDVCDWKNLMERKNRCSKWVNSRLTTELVKIWITDSKSVVRTWHNWGYDRHRWQVKVHILDECSISSSYLARFPHQLFPSCKTLDELFLANHCCFLK